VDVESTCEFEKEGSKRTQGPKQRPKDLRMRDGTKRRERVCVCVCMAMGWLCVSCSILLAGESRRDENEIGRGENATRPVALRGPARETLVESWPRVHGAARGYLYRVW